MNRSEKLVRGLAVRSRWSHAFLTPHLTLTAGYPSLARWRALLPGLKVSRSGAGLSVRWPKGTSGFSLPLSSGGVMLLGPFRKNNGAPQKGVLELVRSLLNEEASASESLRLKNHTLGAVLHLGKAMAGARNLSRLIAMEMVPEMVQLLDADRGSVFLIDHETQELYSVVAMGVELKEIRFPLDRGLAGYVARTGELLNVADAHKDERFNPEIDRKTGYRTRSVLAAPMVGVEGQLVGVIQVINKKGAEVFGPEDEELVTAVASEAAIAVCNVKLVEEQRQMLESFITSMATALDARDGITAGHTNRVTEYALGIGRVMGLKRGQLEHVRIAGMLHDLGKVNTPDAVLKKPAKLTPEEYETIKLHAFYTHEIVGSIKLPPELKGLPEESGGHHEKVDGSGYPHGLKGKDIPIVARILAVADVFDAITSKRHYREAMPIEQALSVIREGSGSHFDPDCVAAFFEYFERELRSRFTGSAASS